MALKPSKGPAARSEVEVGENCFGSGFSLGRLGFGFALGLSLSLMTILTVTLVFVLALPFGLELRMMWIIK